MDVEGARTVGWRVHLVRHGRGKSLRVIAGLAGMSKSHLDRIERGERSPTLREVVALAQALQVAPSELTKLPVPAPANGGTDVATEAVRLALDAVEAEQPDGQVMPVGVLRDQVARIHAQRRACRFAEVATDLPGLIRNLHTMLATGAAHGQLLDLAVYLHVHVTRLWLGNAGAPEDLIRRAVFLARRLAQERDEVTTLAMAAFGVADALLCGGALQLGRTELDSITLPPTTAHTVGLVCQLTAAHAEAAAVSDRRGDTAAPMEAVADMLRRFGEPERADPLGFAFGSVNAGVHRMYHALEMGEPDQAVSVAQDVDPERHPYAVNRAYYWVHYGRALARLRRQDEAVQALRTAEDIFPTKVRRDPGARAALGELLTRSQRDAVGVELRGLAYRAGLPV